MLSNCAAGVDSFESPSDYKEIKPVDHKGRTDIHWKDWCWSWSSNTLAAWYKVPTHEKRPWCWERLRVGGEWGNREWDGWMASLTQWMWIWANSDLQWRTGKPGLLQSMVSQRVRHSLATEQQHNIESEGSSLVRQSGLPKAECLLMLCVRVQSSFLFHLQCSNSQKTNSSFDPDHFWITTSVEFMAFYLY